MPTFHARGRFVRTATTRGPPSDELVEETRGRRPRRGDCHAPIARRPALPLRGLAGAGTVTPGRSGTGRGWEARVQVAIAPLRVSVMARSDRELPNLFEHPLDRARKRHEILLGRERGDVEVRP